MRLLLDTQAFLWFILAEPRLSATALGLITDPLNHKHVSPASYWEIAIKIRLGKYALPVPFEPFMSDQIARNYFTILPITVKHAAVLTTLPLHHRDPFDRLPIEGRDGRDRALGVLAFRLQEDLKRSRSDGL